MNHINEIQKEFFKTLSSIQENAIYQALDEYDENDSLEDLLYNTTYEAMTSICELLDGYTNDKLQLDLIDKNSNKSLKTGIQMHDVCASYLKWENLNKRKGGNTDLLASIHDEIPRLVQQEKETSSNAELLDHLDKLHTTELGVVRIKKNLSLDTDDVIAWCKDKIRSDHAIITRRGKNWYVAIDGFVITVNAHSDTIITAHKEKR